MPNPRYKLARNKMAHEKMDIKNRYLAGEPVPQIAKSKGVTTYAIYFHLGQLTPDEKALHLKNSLLRKKTLPVQKRKLTENYGTEQREPTKSAYVIGSDLADFIQSGNPTRQEISNN